MQKRHTNRKQYFKELAQTCEKYFLPFIEHHKEIVPELNILEIGCGECGNLQPFSKRGCKVTGIDISDVRIEEAKQFFQEEDLQGNFLCQDIFAANFEEKFDIIIIHDVIEHVLAKKRLLTIAKNLLNSNGIIYVGFPPWLLGRIAKNEALLAKVPDAAALAASLVPQQKGSQLTISRDQTSKISASILQHFQEAITADARRRESANNLKHLGLAFHNFHDKYQSFPPAASFDADGKPLLSWRVFLLPALGEQKLYEQFRLNEPWDSEHNKALVDKMPEIFQSPRTPALPGHTVFQVITGEKTLFAGKSGKGMPDIKDGTSNTVLVVETIAERAVPWTKPADLELDPAAPYTGLVEGRDGFWTTFCDGSARFISKDVAPETLLKLFMPADGQVIGEF